MGSHSLRRLHVLRCHLVTVDTHQDVVDAAVIPHIGVSSDESMYDEPVKIRLECLRPNETVTLVASVTDGATFISCAVFNARDDGSVDLARDAPIQGTYSGVDPMGLFWSMVPSPDQNKGSRLITKDASVPRVANLQVHRTKVDLSETRTSKPILEKSIKRLHMKKGVKRIPITDGDLRGTVFVPEGDGPFPAIIDLFGGLVTRVESRAALLASHGYVTFALTYMFLDHLPKDFSDVTVAYFVKATEWFSEQPYVDSNRIAAVGLCFGGLLAVNLAHVCPKIKAVVNINGLEYRLDMPAKTHPRESVDDRRLIKMDDGSVIIKNIFQLQRDDFVPLWERDTKVLVLVSESDLMVDPANHYRFREEWLKEKKENIKLVSYPGAGHLIEPPYAPMFSGIRRQDKKRSQQESLPSYMQDTVILSGGNPRDHAFAQKDGWKQILDFLKQYL